jgi:putative ABC transport system permease protein
MRSWLRRLTYLLRQSRHDADLREEIEAHRELRAAHLEREGLTSPEADDASRRAIGNVLLAREDAREVWLGSLSTVWQDLREASQSLARSPSFTIPVVLSLALAIGANVAAFSVVNALALRPLPVSDPHSLFLVTYSDGARSDAGGNFAWYEYCAKARAAFPLP